MKKLISLFSIALVIAGILIIWTYSLTLSSEQIPEAKKNNAHTQKVWKEKSKLIQRNVRVIKQPCLTQSVQGIEEVLSNASAPLDQKLVSKFQPADLDTEMRHPALADGGGGYLVKFWENIFYSSPIESTLQMRGSTDDGASWHTPIVWSQQYPPGYPGYFPQGGGLPRYPSLGHWGSDGTYDHIFYGTCVSPSTYHNGGEPQLFVIKDILDDTTWAKWRWTFDTSDGTRNMKCAEIAVDSSQHYENPLAEERPWGIQGLILSQPSNPEHPHTDAPYLFWQYNEDGWALMNYYYDLEGCQSIDAAIDPVTATAYTVFDRPDTVDHKYRLCIRQDPWDMMTKESYVLPDLAWEPQLVIWSTYFEDSLANIEHPVVAVHGGNLVVVFEVMHQPNPDSIDLEVWHCYDGNPLHFMYRSYIAGSEYDERYPEIAWVDSNYFVCTFVKQNKLFASKSCGGGFWSDPVQISQAGDVVLMDYRVADIADNGTKVIYSYTTGPNQTKLRIVDLGLDIFPPSTHPPDVPYLFFPDFGANNVPPDSVILQWAGGDEDGDCMTYDIYFGSASPPPLVATQSVKEGYDPGILEALTTYHWKIVAKDDQDTSWSAAFFTTGSPVPPQILSTSPTLNKLNVPISADISVTFNVSMDSTTINDSTFIVNARSTGRRQGMISYDNTTKTATFNPSTDFAAGELVSAELTTDIKSLWGTPLSKSYVWSFTTVAKGGGTFVPQTVYPVGDGPQSVFAADLDKDGDLDLAIGNLNSDNLLVLLNNGDGTFIRDSVYAVGDGPHTVISADIDGDGDLDLITSNINSNNVSVLKNNGNGTFTPQSVYPVGQYAYSVVAVDLDGDGDLDLATANAGSNNVSVLLNNGNGTFAPQVTYAVANNSFPLSICAGDFDRDGDLDLATANNSTGKVAVLLNNGNGTFAPYSVYPAGAGPYSIFTADLDGDGNLDLACGHGSSVVSKTLSVLLNNGDGTFAPYSVDTVGNSPLSIFAADLNGDGNLDLVTGNADNDNVSVLFNNGNGTFAPQSTFAVGDFPYSVIAADLDGDGDLDLVTTNRDSDNISVLLNFLHGDCNSDGVINVTDIVYLINYLFISGPPPQPWQAGDANCDGTINVTDVVYLINYLYIGGPPPCNP